MPILLALMIVAIWAQVIAWIYALINPFNEQMKDIQQYNQAYYWAIAGIERAELALKKHTAGFEWSGWWINWNTYWPSSDFKNINKKYFWPLAYSGYWYGSFWEIKNLSEDWIIPLPGKWNLDSDVSTGNDYYQLTFDKSFQVALYKDESWKDTYYTGYSSLTDIKIDSSLDVSIRVPQKLYDVYTQWAGGNALDENNNIDLDWDDVVDDIIVNRSLFGYTWDTQYTIFPSINISWDNTVDTDDTAIREDVINAYSSSSEYNIKYNISPAWDTNPCEVWTHTQNVTEFNQSPEDAVSTWFDIAIAGDDVHEVNAKFSLVNLLKFSDEKVYPYLEIKVRNNTTLNTNKPLPDKYFYIKWEWKLWQYDVRIKISKPVFDTTAASDFTVLF